MKIACNLDPNTYPYYFLQRCFNYTWVNFTLFRIYLIKVISYFSDVNNGY